MALQRWKVQAGITIDNAGDISEIIPIGNIDLTTTGLAAEIGSLALKDTGSGAELWQKTGAGNTAWTNVSEAGTETGHISGFVGKSGTGLEYPQYTSTNQVTADSTGTAGDGDNLEEAISVLDSVVGADATLTPLTRTLAQLVASESLKQHIEDIDTTIGADSELTALTRSVGQIATSQTIYANLDDIDAVIGADADMTSSTYIGTGSTIFTNLAGLDAQVLTNTNAIAALGTSTNWNEKVDHVVDFATDNTDQATLLAAGSPPTSAWTWLNVSDGHIRQGDGAGGSTILVNNSTVNGQRVAVKESVTTVHSTFSVAAPATARNADIIYLGGSGNAAQDGTNGTLAAGDMIRTDSEEADGNPAIFAYKGTGTSASNVKIGDFDWQLATGINLSSGYPNSSNNGSPAASMTIEQAIEYLHNNQDDIQSALGISQGAVNLGTFTGSTIADGSTIKVALQALETEVETKAASSVVTEIDANVDDLITLTGVAENTSDLGTFTGATIADSSTIKAALQALETAHEETDANADDLVTLTGVAENATDLGTFTGATIADSSTLKAALQALETAHEETDTNADDLITLTGVAENATHLGTFTGSTIPDNRTIKEALQDLESAIEVTDKDFQVTSITDVAGAVTLDTVTLSTIPSYGLAYHIVLRESSNSENRYMSRLDILTDGVDSADFTEYAIVAFSSSNITDVTYAVSVVAGVLTLTVDVEDGDAGTYIAEIKRASI